MEASLHVPPSRGMVRFIPAAEECLAWGSKTVAGRISDAVAKDREIASEGEGSKSHERRILKVHVVFMLLLRIRICTDIMLTTDSHYRCEGLQRTLRPRVHSLQLLQNMKQKPSEVLLLA